MTNLSPVLDHLRPQPILLGMDSNLHHITWNPLLYTHTHREADDFISLMNNANLLLRSEPGTST